MAYGTGPIWRYGMALGHQTAPNLRVHYLKIHSEKVRKAI